ncbi:hypothetical protein [Schlesneria sp. DSM 10557]|uniref:hypothetical protein n=1 Tax=Schlesneria sp. DSM 10557 TaxID=3044399 RepID=UPI00359FD033
MPFPPKPRRQTRLFLSLFLLWTTGLAGCGTSPPSDRSNMMDQVLGALQVQGAAKRDAALAESCRQSADAGDGFAVMQGLPLIQQESLRNQVAVECAEALSGCGKQNEAIDAANLITKEEQREELVNRLEAGT